MKTINQTASSARFISSVVATARDSVMRGGTMKENKKNYLEFQLITRFSHDFAVPNASEEECSKIFGRLNTIRTKVNFIIICNEIIAECQPAIKADNDRMDAVRGEKQQSKNYAVLEIKDVSVSAFNIRQAAQDKLERENIKLHMSTLCRGFIHRYQYSENGPFVEKLYALLPDGRVLRSEECSLPNPCFNKPGREWVHIPALTHDDIRTTSIYEFCGNYSIPTLITNDKIKITDAVNDGMAVDYFNPYMTIGMIETLTIVSGLNIHLCADTQRAIFTSR